MSTKDRLEGHYWVRFGTSPNWDVVYWRDGHFWDNGDSGYGPDNFEVGPRVYSPAEAAPPSEVRVRPLDTAPSGDDALEPSEIEVHEGAWALIIGTNAKPAGWVDTHELFAHQLYCDQILPTKELQQGGEG